MLHNVNSSLSLNRYIKIISNVSMGLLSENIKIAELKKFVLNLQIYATIIV